MNIRDRHGLDEVRRRFLDGHALPADLLPPAVASSWERSRNAGLSPWDKRLAGRWRAHELSQSDVCLAASAQPELDRLWGIFGGQEWALFCVNLEGVIVYAKHASTSDVVDSLKVGKRVNEMDIGTTAPSCVLHEQQPFIVCGGMHYLKEFEDFFCVSVPVFGVHGELVGAIDITGVGQRNASAVLEQLKIAAMAIESRLYSGLIDCRIVALQFDARLIGTPFQGLIAFDQNGTFCAANKVAKKILGIDASVITESSLSWDNFFKRVPHSNLVNTPCLIALNDGSSVYAQTLIASDSSLVPSCARHSANGIGLDPALNQQFNMASKAFVAGIPIFLQGETGTGKEVFARALHDSLKPNAPFIAINCSAIPENLIESELFGYVEGTFTGARRGGTKGRIEEASGGTLLLDEIGDMPFTLQTRLLRVLQEREVTRLGSSERHPIDVRVISATHCDIKKLIQERRFREDLFYRLNGVQICIPALRERQDLENIILTLTQRYQGGSIHPDALKLIKQQEWRGNIRQLEQAIRLAVVLAGAGLVILEEHFPGLDQPVWKRSEKSLKELERKRIQDALDANRGNVKATAVQLGIARGTIYRKLKLE
ncbi:sigma-54-dependent Fis family transcriptional regulator [Pseudomonas sp. MAFF 302030]|uniref:Sigma-54-dependent Fis family transcriptional regulator n=1 Tax=Pseudomonas morbosilactucae TaxID=2938197 RepID=A0A9X1Z0F4_9PSED|nr:sigma-54-dependent Fis family transcriptional regulator [Pseudomonas morbosilactucae]MCK9801391.1 sigma-54-dependent Fis family transcriptional regulator [Pseudomonas morbosilactucae]